MKDKVFTAENIFMACVMGLGSCVGTGIAYSMHRYVGHRSTHAIEFRYNGKKAEFVHRNFSLMPDKYYIRLENGDMITRGTLTADDGKTYILP